MKQKIIIFGTGKMADVLCYFFQNESDYEFNPIIFCPDMMEQEIYFHSELLISTLGRTRALTPLISSKELKRHQNEIMSVARTMKKANLGNRTNN